MRTDWLFVVKIILCILSSVSFASGLVGGIENLAKYFSMDELVCGALRKFACVLSELQSYLTVRIYVISYLYLFTEICKLFHLNFKVLSHEVTCHHDKSVNKPIAGLPCDCRRWEKRLGTVAATSRLM